MIAPMQGVTARRRAARKRQTQAAARKVYEAVDARDQGVCRACGQYAGPSVHRHHLRGRQETTVQTVCHLCPACHAQIHVRVGGKRLRVWGDANGGLTVERWIDRQRVTRYNQ